GAVQPGPDRPRHPGRRRYELRLGNRPGHLARVRAAAGAPRRRGAAHEPRRGEEADLRQHGRPLARLLRRARCERPRAQPRPGQGASTLMARKETSIFDRAIVEQAIKDSFPKLDPRSQIKNPVMFIVELGSLITTVIFFLDVARGHTNQLWFVGTIAVWLWLT